VTIREFVKFDGKMTEGPNQKSEKVRKSILKIKK